MKDEFEGHGGSYEIDPKTGKKSLVHRTKENDVVPAAEKPYTSKRIEKLISEDAVNGSVNA